MKFSPVDHVFSGLNDEAKDSTALLECVSAFAHALEEKLQEKRKSGKSGWADPEWTIEDKVKQLRAHLVKGDMVDVAAFAMFIWNQQDADLRNPELDSQN